MVRKINISPTDWTPASEFSLIKLKYEKLNPVQSAFLRVYDRDSNMVVAAETSAGKTTIAEMAFAHSVSKGQKCLYLCPLKALAQEKIDTWQDSSHPFSVYKLAIATGDYVLPENRERTLREAAESDITMMTSELFDSLTRRIDKVSEWFSSIGTVVVDESHLLSVPSRGSALECALMRFTEISPARIIFLSATMPNTDEIASWLSILNGKETCLIDGSGWRPCELDVHYIPYSDRGSGFMRSLNLQEKIMDLIMSHNDRFIIFVHSKSFGRKLQQTIARIEEVEFHNADLDKNERIRLEKAFREGNLRILIATSTLAYGLNLPARRVIVADVRRGYEDVPIMDIKQMVGRAGRVGLDPKGDAYILIPETDFYIYNNLLRYMPDIESRLSYKDELAFHVVNEITEGHDTIEKLREWYRRSFAMVRNADETVINMAVEDLITIGAVRHKGDRLVTTPIGKVAAWFYYSPYFVASLKRNFEKISKHDPDDVAISWAIGDAMPSVPMPVEVRNEIYSSEYINLLYDVVDLFEGENIAGKEASCYVVYCTLKGREIPELNGSIRNFQSDSGRLTQALKTIGSFYKIDFPFNDLEVRLQYGVPPEVVPLCRLPGIGGKRAMKLYSNGFRKPEDIYVNPTGASKVIGRKVVEKIIEARV